MEMLSGAQMVVRSLQDEGIEHIFGYPGGSVLDIYDAIFQSSEIEHILVRHEQAAVHMADAYSRTTGKVGTVLVTAGPGATNLAAVLCLGQSVRRRKGHLRVHAVRGRGLPNADDYSAMDPYVKVSLTTPHEPNPDTGQDHTEVRQTKPALEAGMHPVWSKKRHRSVLRLPFNAPPPLSEEAKKKAEHAAWLLGNEDGLCET